MIFQNINKLFFIFLIMKQKKGQFYLIAAFVIITIIIGSFAISNYAKKKSSIKVYNLKEDLEVESERVLSYGIYNAYNESEMLALLANFTELYAKYAGEDIEIYFIFGNFEKIIIVGYQELTTDVPQIDLSLGETAVIQTTEEGDVVEIKGEYFPETKVVIVTINEIEYEFELKAGENFYFVISQKIGDEGYIVTG